MAEAMYQGPLPTNLSERMAYVFNALMHAVMQGRQRSPVLMVVGLSLWVRLQRLRNRVLKLMARIAAGTVRRGAGPRGVAARAMDPARRGRLGQYSTLWKGVPRGFGWLLPLLPGEAATQAGFLERALGEAEMRVMLAACPGLVEVLRPFCRMLGMDAAVLAVSAEEAAAAALVVAQEKAEQAVKAAEEAAARAAAPAAEVPPVDPAAHTVPFWQRISWARG